MLSYRQTSSKTHRGTAGSGSPGDLINREDGWSVEVGPWLATELARELALTEAFAATWRMFVWHCTISAGRYPEPAGEQVDRFLADARRRLNQLSGRHSA